MASVATRVGKGSDGVAVERKQHRDVADEQSALGGVVGSKLVDPADAGPGSGHEVAPLPREDVGGDVGLDWQHGRLAERQQCLGQPGSRHWRDRRGLRHVNSYGH